MQKHPKVFNDLYVSMVKSGETGGSLDTTLLKLAAMLEREVHLRGKIKSAMTYPVAVVGLVVLIMSAMLLFVVPQFEGIYEQLGGTLPLPTRALLAMSDIFKSYWYIVSSASSFLGRFLFRRYKTHGEGTHHRRPTEAARPGLRQPVPQDGPVAVLQHVRHAAQLGRADPAGAGHRVRHREQQGDRLQGRRRRADERPGG